MLGLGTLMPPMPTRCIGNKSSIYFDGVNDYAAAQNSLFSCGASTSGLYAFAWVKWNHNAATQGDPMTIWQTTDTGTDKKYIRLSARMYDAGSGNYWQYYVDLKDDEDHFSAMKTSYVTGVNDAVNVNDWHLVLVQINIDEGTYKARIGLAGIDDVGRHVISLDDTNVSAAGESFHNNSETYLDGTNLHPNWGQSMSTGDVVTVGSGWRWNQPGSDWLGAAEEPFEGLINELNVGNSVISLEEFKRVYYAQGEHDYSVGSGNWESGAAARNTVWYRHGLNSSDNATTVFGYYGVNNGGSTATRLELQNGAELSSDTPRK